MTCSTECSQFDLAMELLIENGFDGIAEAVGVLLNTAIKLGRSRHLNAGLYERKAERIGYANGYKAKSMRTRLGEIELAIPQTRGTDFYPQSLECGLRSERALKLALAEMYVQGVSTRKVDKVTEELCGFEISSAEVSRASQTLDEQLQAWRSRPLSTAYPYVYLDARYEKTPDLASWAETAVPEGLAVMKMPEPHCRCLRTVNMLERLNREIKRRTRVATIFPLPAIPARYFA